MPIGPTLVSVHSGGRKTTTYSMTPRIPKEKPSMTDRLDHLMDFVDGMTLGYRVLRAQ